MEEKYTIEDMQNDMKTSDGYMIGVTFLKKDVLTHHLLFNTFLVNDIEISLKKLQELGAVEVKNKIAENSNEPGK